MKTVLTIAGFDPSSGAGVTADLMVFAAHGLFGTSAITALTVQSTLGVRASHPVEADVLRETLDCLAADLPPVGVKIGMVATESNLRTICTYLASLKVSDSILRAVSIVLDPILASTSGQPLLGGAAISSLSSELLPLVDWVTPNADELAALTGRQVSTQEDLAAGARELQGQVEPRAGARNGPKSGPGTRIGVFAKGGHLEQPDDLLLMPDGQEHWLPGERIETSATHGTGCALSSAFLSRLVLGDDPLTGARKAKEYVAEAMRRAPRAGHGKGPMGLLWPLLPERAR